MAQLVGKKLANGQKCTSGPTGAGQNAPECLSGNCQKPKGWPHLVCVGSGVIGDPCVGDNECQSGNCDKSGAKWMCKNQKCKSGADCPSGNCQDPGGKGYQCVGNGVIGANCGNDNECNSGYCEYPAYECKAKKLNGQKCKGPKSEAGKPSSECENGNCQELPGKGLVCVGEGQIGDPCGQDSECKSGFCDTPTGGYWTCKSKLVNGKLCKPVGSNSKCLSGNCQNPLGTGAVCVGNGVEGDICGNDNECQSNNCVDKKCSSTTKVVTKKSLKLKHDTPYGSETLSTNTYKPTFKPGSPLADPLAYILNRVWFKHPRYANQVIFAPAAASLPDAYNAADDLASNAVEYLGLGGKHTMKGFVEYMCKPIAVPAGQHPRCYNYGGATVDSTGKPLFNPDFTMQDWLLLLINQQLQQHVGKNGPLEYITRLYTPKQGAAAPYKVNKIKMEIEAHPNSIVALTLLLWIRKIKPPSFEGLQGDGGLPGEMSYIDYLKFATIWLKSAVNIMGKAKWMLREQMLKNLMATLYEGEIEKRIFEAQRSYYYNPASNAQKTQPSVNQNTMENYVDAYGRELKPSGAPGMKKESSLALTYIDVVDKEPPTTTAAGAPLSSENSLSYTSKLLSWPQASNIILDFATVKKSVTAINNTYYDIPFYKRLEIVLKDLVPASLRMKKPDAANSYLYLIMGYLAALYSDNTLGFPNMPDLLSPHRLNHPYKTEGLFAGFSMKTNLMPPSPSGSVDWEDTATWLTPAVSSPFPYNKAFVYPDILVDKEYEKSKSISAAIFATAVLAGDDLYFDTSTSPFSPPEDGLPASLQSRYKIINIGNRIVKYNTVQESPVQSFIIDTQDASSNQELITLYDSQLFYESMYGYAVTSLLLMPIVYSSYVLEKGPPISTKTGLEYTFNYNQRIGWEIREVGTLASGKTLSMSNFKYPPIPAWVEFYPFRGVNNKILFNFKRVSVGGTDGIILKEIKEEDWESGWQDARDFYEGQNGTPAASYEFPSAESVPFQDQPWEKVRIYQISGDVPPKSVKEFTTLAREVDISKEGSNAILNIEPNVQHYFLFKSVNNVEMVSYPSQIFSVKIYDEGGTVFPVVGIVDLEEKIEIKRDTTAEFTKRVGLKPALLQAAPNIKELDLGYLNPSVFVSKSETKPQFKMRVTSNKTGRKADFNILYRKDKNSVELTPLNATSENVLVSWDSSAPCGQYGQPPCKTKKAADTGCKHDQALSMAGTGCIFNEECCSGKCSNGKCFGNQPATPPTLKKAGAVCLSTAQCAKGLKCSFMGMPGGKCAQANATAGKCSCTAPGGGM